MASSNDLEKNLHKNKHCFDERKLFQTGSVKDKPRTDRLQSRRTQCQEVDNAISKSPKSHQQSCQQSLEYPHYSKRHMKVDLKLLPFSSFFGFSLFGVATARKYSPFDQIDFVSLHSSNPFHVFSRQIHPSAL